MNSFVQLRVAPQRPLVARVSAGWLLLCVHVCGCAGARFCVRLWVYFQNMGGCWFDLGFDNPSHLGISAGNTNLARQVVATQCLVYYTQRHGFVRSTWRKVTL